MAKKAAEMETLEAIVAPVVLRHGCELVDLEYQREQTGWTLRIRIDHPEGVTLERCSVVSRDLSATLDVEDPFDTSYHLEVSSPGLDRPLRRAEDAARFVGRRAKVELREPLEGRRKFRGEIVAVEDGRVLLQEELGSVWIPWDRVKKAHLEVEP
jgi:ribosome maturation factor RimP